MRYTGFFYLFFYKTAKLYKNTQAGIFLKIKNNRQAEILIRQI